MSAAAVVDDDLGRDVEALLSIAPVGLMRTELSGIIKGLAAAVKRNPSCARYRYFLGLALFHAQEYKRAQNEFSAAQRCSPQTKPFHKQLSAYLHMWIASVLLEARFQSGKLTPDLVNQLRKRSIEAIRLDGDSLQIENMTALLAYDTGEHASAIATLTALTTKHPTYLDGHGNIAVFKHLSGQITEAQTMYEDILQQSQLGHVPTLANYGLLLLECKLYKSAADAFRAAVRLSPASAHLWLNLAVTLSALGQAALAQQCYERVLQLRPPPLPPAAVIPVPAPAPPAVPRTAIPSPIVRTLTPSTPMPSPSSASQSAPQTPSLDSVSGATATAQLAAPPPGSGAGGAPAGRAALVASSAASAAEAAAAASAASTAEAAVGTQLPPLAASGAPPRPAAHSLSDAAALAHTAAAEIKREDESRSPSQGGTPSTPGPAEAAGSFPPAAAAAAAAPPPSLRQPSASVITAAPAEVDGKPAAPRPLVMPVAVAAQYNQAVRLMLAGDLYEASRRLQSLPLPADGRAPLVGTTLGNIERRQVACGHSTVERAQQALLQAIQQDPGDAAAWAQLGLLYLTEGDLTEAIRYFLQALSRKETAAAWCNLAVAYQLNGDFSQAEQLYQRALELAPDAPQIWNNLGNLYRQADELDKAEAAFDHCLVLQPNAPDVLNNYALVKLKRGDHSGAHALLQRAIEADPLTEHAPARSNQGRIPRPDQVPPELSVATPVPGSQDL